MFDEKHQGAPNVEDIFADLEKGAPATQTVPRPDLGNINGNVPPRPSPSPSRPPVPPYGPPPVAPEPPVFEREPARGGRKIAVMVIILVIILLALAAGAYFAYKKFFAATLVIPATNNSNVNNPTGTPVQNTNTVRETNVNTNVNGTPAPVAGGERDTEGDGLSDAQEAVYGTDPLKSDTDNDGLLDGEEVTLYKTNPLNPDTDGDTYRDGEEVANGYDPNGPGRIFNVPQE